MENANLKELIAVDLDGSDNLSEDMLFKFINKYGPQLEGKMCLRLSPILTNIPGVN